MHLTEFTYSDCGDPEVHYVLEVDYTVSGRRGTAHQNDINQPEQPEVEVLSVSVVSAEIETARGERVKVDPESVWGPKTLADLRLAISDDERFLELALETGGTYARPRSVFREAGSIGLRQPLVKDGRAVRAAWIRPRAVLEILFGWLDRWRNAHQRGSSQAGK